MLDEKSKVHASECSEDEMTDDEVSVRFREKDASNSLRTVFHAAMAIKESLKGVEGVQNWPLLA